MSDTRAIEILAGALEVAALLAGPLLGAMLAVGVVVSVLQSITQIQEQTLTFVPKLAVVSVLLVLTGNWALEQLVSWVTELWQSIPTFL